MAIPWEARTRHRRCRTRVGLGRTRRRAGDAAARASGRVGPRGSHVGFFDSRRREPIRLRRAPTRADSGLNRSESAGIGQYRPESADIGRNRPVSAETADSGRNSKKKKKKKPRTHRNRPKLVFDCLIDCLLFSFNFELLSCILICKHHGMF